MVRAQGKPSKLNPPSHLDPSRYLISRIRVSPSTGRASYYRPHSCASQNGIFHNLCMQLYCVRLSQGPTSMRVIQCLRPHYLYVLKLCVCPRPSSEPTQHTKYISSAQRQTINTVPVAPPCCKVNDWALHARIRSSPGYSLLSLQS